MKKIKEAFYVLIVSVSSLALVGVVWAANNSQFNQIVNGGTLSVDIKDASKVPVANPSVAMSAVAVDFDCQTSTGIFGTNTERIYVMNPNGADNGWNVTMAATSGATAQWQNAGSTENFDFNDPTTSGCADGADGGGGDTNAGQMSVDPTTNGVITADCGNCTTNNVSLGSAAAFDEGTINSITLLSAAAASSDVGRWYLTAVDISQTIPAEQTADAYSIDMTLTATAL